MGGQCGHYRLTFWEVNYSALQPTFPKNVKFSANKGPSLVPSMHLLNCQLSKRITRSPSLAKLRSYHPHLPYSQKCLSSPTDVFSRFHQIHIMQILLVYQWCVPFINDISQRRDVFML